MRILPALFAATLSLFLGGCATAPPPLPTIEMLKGDRVGLLVEGGNTPTHTHIGTTVFNNFVRQYDYDWNLRTEVMRTVERSLEGVGLEVVDLGGQGIRHADVEGLVEAVDDRWQVASGRADVYRRLRGELGLRALVVLKETRVMTALECAGGPCAERYADASGLYTRSMFGLTSYRAVAAYQWNVYVLDPLADTATAEPLSSMLRMPTSAIAGFTKPQDFHQLTAEEFAPVREGILAIAATTSVQAATSLNVR